MEHVEITGAKVEKFKTDLGDDLLYQIYVAQYNIENAIEELKSLKNNESRKEKLKRHNESIKAFREIIKTGKKMIARREAENNLQVALANKSKLVMAENDLYRKISDQSTHLSNLIQSYKFAQVFDHTKPTILPYAEIDGTRYEMKDNIIAKDPHGQMILYIENNDKNNTAKEA